MAEFNFTSREEIYVRRNLCRSSNCEFDPNSHKEIQHIFSIYRIAQVNST